MASAVRGARGRARRGFKACVAVGALVAVLAGALVTSPAAGQEATGSDVEVRIVARKLTDGRIEFGLQQRDSDDTWDDRRLPRVRFFPTTARVDRWLASSALDLPAGEVRIVARKLTDGRIEFGLQQRDSDDTWDDRRLPRVRFFPTTARTNRWLASSPLTLATARTDRRYVAVSAGNAHTCALRADGTITCWGSDALGQADAPVGRFSAVSAGGNHTCGLRIDNTIACWGHDAFGQADAPVGRFSAVSAGGNHTCGLRIDNTIACWGWHEHGQTDAPAGQFRAVAAGRSHSCGLRTDASIACWGLNEMGSANAQAGPFSALSAGSAISCGLRTDANIDCWGIRHGGNLDPPDGRFTAVSAGGYFHMCGVRTDDTIDCWGWSIKWPHDEYVGQADAPAGRFRAVSTGGYHSCGVRTDGTIACWGDYEFGQTSIPALDSPTPVDGVAQVRPVYLDDEPVLEGIVGFWSRPGCLAGSTESCWKKRMTGNLSSNGYFERPDDKKFELSPRHIADDFWGTNGYHVIYIDAAEKQRARWSFEDVEEGQYGVEIYLPDPKGDDQFRPGAIVRYRIDFDPAGPSIRRTLVARVDQSQFRNRGGDWISLGQIEVEEDSDVRVEVSSYWPLGSRPDEFAAQCSGSKDWECHLAADAARLIPTNGQPDWSSLDEPYKSAKARCVADVTVQILLQPLSNILQGMAVDIAINAVLAVGGAAFTAATGGAAAPAVAAVLATRVGLSVKQALSIGRTVDNIIDALRAVKSLYEIKDVVDNIVAVDTLIHNIGAIVLEIPGGNKTVNRLADLCESEKVWENYYGSPNVWDSLKKNALSVLEWLGARFR